MSQPLDPTTTGSALPPPRTPVQRPVHRRNRFVVLVLLLAVGAVGSACGSEDDDSSADTTQSSTRGDASTAAPSSTAVAPPPATTEPAPPPASAPAATFAMPDFVGMDLQSAQDLVQTDGVWLSVSHDLLGSRNQVIDSNWVVCTQNIPAGQQVSTSDEGEIDFGVVKREERCP